ncbi:hypothetical protein ACIF6K_26590 [Streptomyces sp. NPDC085942]|uniref:hypothetical protein n=1 Tax=Streptomyces sp. NPDC085942 TaxID=3365743 RepID=UPI0037D94C29
MTTPPTMKGARPAGYIVDEATLAAPGAQAADDLRAVREQWGDLLSAIGRPPRAEWPPRECREWEQPPAAEDAPAVGRLPLILREHPAPLNLTALDAATTTERELFELCDTVAAAVQRPVRRHLVGRRTPDATLMRWAADPADLADPARWHPASARDALIHPTSHVITGTDPRTEDDRAAQAEHREAEQRAQEANPTRPLLSAPAPRRPPVRSDIPVSSPGSRAYGLHWAAVWLEGRALGEESGDLFTAVRPLLADEIAATARRARARVERALGRDGQPTALDRPCPYCGGPLTAHTRSGDPAAATVVCGTGSSCTAPVLLSAQGRREWAGAELVGLFVALEAARE